jgi:hypothetical protein
MPDFIYIGTSKAGSTWIYNVLAAHPDVYISPGKGTYFFDQHFERGVDWYASQFSRAGDKTNVGEIAHSYLSSPEAAERVAELLPDVKLVVCLRDPVDRAFSAYMDSVKNGRFEGTFEAALEANPSLLARGTYAVHLERYLACFSREQLHVAVFDDLKSVPQHFADGLYEFIGLERRLLAASDRKKMMPAAEPRSRFVTRYVKRAARAADKIGLRNLRGRIKRSRSVRNLLYRPLKSSEIPSVHPDTEQRCRDHFREDIRRLDELFGMSLVERWNY